MTDIDYWSIRAKISSEKQKRYFGSYGAWRPYLFVMIDGARLVDVNLMRMIIESSFSDSVVEGVSYKKYFQLERDNTFEFQFARFYFDYGDSTYHYGKFRTISL